MEEKLKAKFNFNKFAQKIEDKTSFFFYGYAYPIIIAILGLIFYMLNLSYLGIGVFAFIASFIFIFYSDITPFLPIMTMFLFVINGQKYYSDNFIVLAIIAGIAFIAFLTRFFRQNYKFVGGELYLPLLFVCLSTAIAGLNTDYVYYYEKGLAGILTIGPLSLLIYFVFRNNIKITNKVNLKIYYPFVMMVTGLLITFELFLSKADKFNIPSLLMEFTCCNVNGAGLFIMIAVFFTFYLAIETKKFYRYFIVMFIEFAGIIFSDSDGVFLICFGMTVLTILSMFFVLNKHDFKNCLISFAILGLISLIIVLYIYGLGISKDYFQKLPDKIFKPTGRIELYNKALILFIKNPILGVGFGYSNEELLHYVTGDWSIFYFHSTIYQILASLGIVGIFVYSFYIFRKYKILSHKQNLFTYFSLIAFTSAQLYGLIDNVEFIPTPSLLTITILVAVVEVINYSSEKTNELPLKNIYNKHI